MPRATASPTNLEFDVLVLQGLHVEPNGRDGLDVIVRLVLEAVKDGRLPRIVQAQDEDTDLL